MRVKLNTAAYSSHTSDASPSQFTTIPCRSKIRCRPKVKTLQELSLRAVDPTRITSGERSAIRTIIPGAELDVAATEPALAASGTDTTHRSAKTVLLPGPPAPAAQDPAPAAVTGVVTAEEPAPAASPVTLESALGSPADGGKEWAGGWAGGGGSMRQPPRVSSLPPMLRRRSSLGNTGRQRLSAHRVSFDLPVPFDRSQAPAQAAAPPVASPAVASPARAEHVDIGRATASPTHAVANNDRGSSDPDRQPRPPSQGHRAAVGALPAPAPVPAAAPPPKLEATTALPTETAWSSPPPSPPPRTPGTGAGIGVATIGAVVLGAAAILALAFVRK